MDKVSVAPPPKAIFWTQITFCEPVLKIVPLLFNVPKVCVHG